MTYKGNTSFINLGELGQKLPGINNISHYISTEYTATAAMTMKIEGENCHPITGQNSSTGLYSLMT
ncbi:unnamed protein product [marine sediment metagenome]|uniref:Uncharacterized protein n=1 Tax=marine sediment metagenome TaxID=412755 RepID=X1E4J3_9ZZZZ